MGKSAKWLKFLSVKKKSQKPSSSPGRAEENASSDGVPCVEGASSRHEEGSPGQVHVTPAQVPLQNEAAATIPEGVIDNSSASAIKIQTAFRAFLVTKGMMVDDFVQARRALRALKGLVRLQALVRGHAVRKQAALSLRTVLVIVKVQALARGHLQRTSEHGQNVQKQLWQKRQGSKGSSFEQEHIREATSIPKPTKAEAGKFSRKLLAYANEQQKPLLNVNESIWLEHWTAACPWKVAPLEPKVSSKTHSLQNGSSHNGEHSADSTPIKRRKSEGSSKVPSYMAATESAKAKLRMSSPKVGTPPTRESPENAMKRRFSLPGTHGKFQDPITHPRRLSFPVRAR